MSQKKNTAKTDQAPETVRLLLAGEGGQGVQVVAEIISKAAFSEGREVSYIPNFGVEQRGGVSLAFVIIGRSPIAYPKFREADWLVIFSERATPRVALHRGKRTRVILGPAVTGGIKTKYPPAVWNIVVLREINRLGKLVKNESLKTAMGERFAAQFAKRPEIKKLDEEALAGE